MADQKISLEKRELMAKRNILSLIIPLVDSLVKLNKDILETAKDAGLSEAYLKTWVRSELASLELFSSVEDEACEDFVDDTEEDEDTEDEEDSEDAEEITPQ